MFCAAGCLACCLFFFKLIIDLRKARGKVLWFLWANTTIITSDLQAYSGLILTSCAFIFLFFALPFTISSRLSSSDVCLFIQS